MHYRFGDLELRPDTRELLRAGTAQPIEPQVFHLLQRLLEARERIVSVDKLVVPVWEERFVLAENASADPFAGDDHTENPAHA